MRVSLAFGVPARLADQTKASMSGLVGVLTASDLGAGERIRTADLPFTRRLLCLLSYTGGETLCIVAGLCGG
jgi:hypothetical protein